MKVLFFGVRGTSPVASPDFGKFGGETTAVLIEGAGGERIAIDAGTGLRNLAAHLKKNARRHSLLMLLTHYHLDHIMGLPWFLSSLDRRWKITIASARPEGLPAREAVSRILARPFWPVQIRNLQARISFKNLPVQTAGRPLRYGGLEVRWCALHHPGSCSAYRLDEPSTAASFVFATDVEWEKSSAREKANFRRLCVQTGTIKLLAFDGQLSRKDYRRFRGWGHSTWQDGVSVARSLEAEKLLVTHHSPDGDDKRLEKIEGELTKLKPGARLAREGMEISIGRS